MRRHWVTPSSLALWVKFPPSHIFYKNFQSFRICCNISHCSEFRYASFLFGFDETFLLVWVAQQSAPRQKKKKKTNPSVLGISLASHISTATFFSSDKSYLTFGLLYVSPTGVFCSLSAHRVVCLSV